MHKPNQTSFKKGYKVPPEVIAKRTASVKGANHWNWKGDKVGYFSLHDWVNRELGSPKHCAICHDEKRKKYEWANISHAYKRDLSDWIRLCVPCHKAYDMGKIKLK